MIEIRDGVAGKVCLKCTVWKSLESGFAKHKRHKDGHQPWCRVCDKSHRVDNPNNRCVKCCRRRGDFKEFSGTLDEYFGNHKSYCKKCENENWRQRAAPNGVSHAAVMRKSEKRRKSEAESGFIDYYESKLLQYIYGYSCLYSDNPNGPICGISCKSYSDHVIPLSKGGMHYAYNRQPLCRSHNSSKGDHNSIDYRPDKGILALAIHNLRIGQCTDRTQKKQYYEWVIVQIELHGVQILHTLPHIFDWLEPLELAA